MKTFRFEKIRDKIPGLCFFCSKKALSILTSFKTGEEVFCCELCGRNRGYVKVVKNLVGYYGKKPIKSKIESVLRVKKSKDGVLLGGVRW